MNDNPTDIIDSDLQQCIDCGLNTDGPNDRCWLCELRRLNAAARLDALRPEVRDVLEQEDRT